MLLLLYDVIFAICMVSLKSLYKRFNKKTPESIVSYTDTFLDFRDIKEDSNSVDVITKARMETLSLTAIKICNILISLLTISSPNKYSSCHS